MMGTTTSARGTQILDQLSRHAAHLGHYAELRLQTNAARNITVTGGNVIQNASSTMSGTSVRAYDDGAFGFASLPSLSDDAIPGAMRAARENAALLQRHAGRSAGDLPDAGAGTGIYDYGSSAPALTADEEMGAIRDLDAHLRSAYPDLANITVSYRFLSMAKGLANSAGAMTYSYVPRSIMLIQFAKATDDGIVQTHDVFGGFGDPQDQLADLTAFHEDLDRLHEEVCAKAEGVYCTPGEHDVILDSSLAGILAHEAIGHTCEADLVLGGSVAGDHVGDLVASEKVTLVDYAERGPDGNGGIAIHVDDEGTPCKDVTIIENGVLKGFLHNKETAKKMGVEPTGNARAFDFSDEPLVRMRNTAIAPGADKLDDMIASVEHGYYFLRATNGQADSSSEFMFGVGMGYEIVDGRLGKAVRDTTIAGVAFDMLKTVTHVSDEMTWSSGGMCGKKQMIPVGMGGPAVKCRIGVGGRA